MGASVGLPGPAKASSGIGKTPREVRQPPPPPLPTPTRSEEAEERGTVTRQTLLLAGPLSAEAVGPRAALLQGSGCGVGWSGG